MGTKMHCKSYFPGLYSMRDLNDDSSNSSWPLFYENKMAAANGQYYNGFMPRTLENGNSRHEKDALKQKMLEHEAVFKNQVLELHRLYRIQRDMMEDFKKKEASMEPASSSSLEETQGPAEKARKWHMAGFPLSNSSHGVESFSSPTTCTEGIPFQNGCTSKNSEVLGLRPLKVRKKLFDLHLPADEYVDIEEEENCQGYKKADSSSYSRNGDANNGAVDLNEPIHNEEARASSSIDYLGHTSESGEIKTIHDKMSINSSIDSLAIERGRLPHVNIAAGSSKDKLLPSFYHSGQGTISHVHPPPLGTYSNGYSREEKWRDGFQNGLVSSDRCYSHSTISNLEPIVSQAPASHSFFSSSSFASSWFQTVSSWAHPSTSFTPKTTTLETPINAVGGISRPLGVSWPVDDCRSKLNSGLRSELESSGLDHGFAIFPNGSCHADSRPAIDINLNEELPQSTGNENAIMQDLNMADGKTDAEDNLAALPWLKHKRVHVDEVMDTRRSEQSRELSYHHASSSELCSKNGTVRDLNQLMSTPCDSATPGDKGVAQGQAVKKILGFPIFERELSSASVNVNCFPERKNGTIDINVACEPDEQIAAEELTTQKEKRRKATPNKDHIDLNSCVSDSEDPSPAFYDRIETSAKINLEIDLEAQALLEREDDNSESQEKLLNEVSVESFEDRNKKTVRDEEILRDAAESLVNLSSCPMVVDAEDSNILVVHEVSSFKGALLLLVDAISSDSKETDDFEAMALELVETKEEDYMPKPFIPELEHVEARPLQTRTRRGLARRGRQWRDFQRDVLPGLASLSRHEVTEDIQIFGGMMRATGQTWNSGLRRNGARNGGGRGRRRAVVESVVEIVPPLVEKLSSIEGGLEERSLTGWGKTTRRPRRQRCPSGNLPSAMVLT